MRCARPPPRPRHHLPIKEHVGPLLRFLLKSVMVADLAHVRHGLVFNVHQRQQLRVGLQVSQINE